ncbi:MAG TPA: peroxidase-related enzyme, partial [Candidatus Acidoferrales bacterium]
RLVKDDALVEQLKRDYTQAPITPAERAMLDYAVKLTREPWSVTRDDVERLRAHSLSDGAILDLNMVVSYYAYVNRIADGLGAELESFWDEHGRCVE